MVKKIVTLILFLLSFAGLAFSQDTICFTNNEIDAIYSHTKELEYKDSIQTELIILQEKKIDKLEYIEEQSTVIINHKDIQIDLLGQQINIYKDQVKHVKPKWYQNRYLNFFIGFGAASVAGYVYSRY